MTTRNERPDLADGLVLWVVLRGLPSGLSNVVFPAEVVTDRARERSDGDCYRPEDGEDEENTRLIPGDDATRALGDQNRRHPGDKNADRHAGQQHAAAIRLRWRRRLFPGRRSKACVSACGDFPVDSLKERLHYRVAVFGAKLLVRLGGGADLLRRKW